MNKIYAVLPKRIGTISPYLYGVFAEHIGGVFYDGLYVGKDSGVENIRGFRKAVVEKMREAKIPLIRWPGGCFAETYDWRDGIGPQEGRPVRINWWTERDGRYEPNLVGTDEFLDLCAMTGAEPYFAANITSSTPLAIRDWIDYCNSPAGSTTMARLRETNGHRDPYGVKLWGVGNETWGGGGRMSPESYAMEYRRYAEVMKNADRSIELIASGANSVDYSWTRRMMALIAEGDGPMDGMSFHYYSFSDDDPTNFDAAGWYRLLGRANRIEELIRRHYAGVASYGWEEKGKLVIDEWGAWHRDGSGPSGGYNLFEQQSTLRDAALAALTLNHFNNNADKIKIATVAQLVNNLHALFLAGGENCIVTPTWHVFNLYKAHQGAEAVECFAESGALPEGLPGISASASVKNGVMTLTAVNLSAEEAKEVPVAILGGKAAGNAVVRTLSDEDLTAHNSFVEPDRIKIAEETCEAFPGMLYLPKGSVVTLTVPVESGD